MSDKKRKTLLIALSSLLVIVIGIIAYMLINNHMIESQYTAAISQAEKYLQDKNYEDALVSYKQALALDPDSEDPYLGLANTYVAMGDSSKAVSILNQGLERIDSSKLKNLLNQLGNSDAASKELLTKDSGEIALNTTFEQKITSYSFENFKDEFGPVESANMDREGYLEVVHKDLDAIFYYMNTADNKKIVDTSKKRPYKSAMPEKIQLKSLQVLFNNWEGYVSINKLEVLVGKQLEAKKEDGKYVIEFDAGDYMMKVETDKEGNISSGNAWNELTLKNANQTDVKKSTVFGVVTNAETKEGVKQASLKFTPKDDEATGETAVTDDKGAFEIEVVPGKYVITITADEFEKKEIEFEVKEGKNYSSEDFEITPEVEEGTVKIELQWKKSESLDLEIHLEGYSDGWHFRGCNKSEIQDAPAKWERQETSEYVTETITIYDALDRDEWCFYVFLQEGVGINAINGATAKVYIPGEPVTSITLDTSSDVDDEWSICAYINYDHQGEFKVINHTRVISPPYGF